MEELINNIKQAFALLDKVEDLPYLDRKAHV